MFKYIWISECYKYVTCGNSFTYVVPFIDVITYPVSSRKGQHIGIYSRIAWIPCIPFNRHSTIIPFKCVIWSVLASQPEIRICPMQKECIFVITHITVQRYTLLSKHKIEVNPFWQYINMFSIVSQLYFISDFIPYI